MVEEPVDHLNNDLAERGKARHAQHPAFLFEPPKESSSPYINRFLSADTIVPGYANPQNLNRYSYVVNNPLKFTDPTGHMADPGEGGGTINSTKYPCAGMMGLSRDICRNGQKNKPKNDDEIADFLLPARNSGSKITGTLNGAMFVGWQGSLTLVTTSDGYAQWYEESALGAQLINAGWSLTQGNIDGLSSTADYAGPATGAFLNAGPATVVWWQAKDKSTKGFDSGISIGILPLELGTARVNAQPLREPFRINLFFCRLISMCGR